MMGRQSNPPFVKEYGCLQMSHVFFLLCASHVVKLTCIVSFHAGLCGIPWKTAANFKNKHPTVKRVL